MSNCNTTIIKPYDINACMHLLIVKVTNGDSRTHLSIIAKYYHITYYEVDSCTQGETINGSGIIHESVDYNPIKLCMQQSKRIRCAARCLVNEEKYAKSCRVDSEGRLFWDEFLPDDEVTVTFISDDPLYESDIEVINV